MLDGLALPSWDKLLFIIIDNFEPINPIHNEVRTNVVIKRADIRVRKTQFKVNQTQKNGRKETKIVETIKFRIRFSSPKIEQLAEFHAFANSHRDASRTVKKLKLGKHTLSLHFHGRMSMIAHCEQCTHPIRRSDYILFGIICNKLAPMRQLTNVYKSPDISCFCCFNRNNGIYRKR